MFDTSVVRKHYQHKSIEYGLAKIRLEHTLNILHNTIYARILDVGCGSGELGSYLKTARNYIVGIDISTTSSEIAGKVLDKVYTLDIERQPLPQLKTFDLIILSDIIEHLFSPPQVIKKLLPYLSPTGKMLISTPNFLYWGNRINFLLGKFKYEQIGPFEEGHIRFFTYSSLRQLLEEAGLTIDTNNHLAAGAVSKHLVKFFPSFFAYHFIVLCKKTPLL